jgi:uncharacterized protein YcfL
MKKNLRFFFPALAVSLAAAFTACSTTVNTVESANPQATITPEAMKKIETDSSLGSAITPIMLNTGTSADGSALKVQLQVQNKTRKTAYVNYRVDWFDKQGMTLPGYNPSMTSLAVEGGEIKAITAVAPSPNATDFRFTFLERKGD